MKIITVGFLIWSFFNAKYGASFFLFFIALLEGYYIFLHLIKKHNVQNIRDTVFLDDRELRIYIKYYLFYRYPISSARMSKTFSLIQLSSFVLVPWLAFNKLWFFAILILGNITIVFHLSRRLRPLYFSKIAKKSDPMYSEKKIIENVYDKLFSKNRSPIYNELMNQIDKVSGR